MKIIEIDHTEKLYDIKVGCLFQLKESVRGFRKTGRWYRVKHILNDKYSLPAFHANTFPPIVPGEYVKCYYVPENLPDELFEV